MSMERPVSGGLGSEAVVTDASACLLRDSRQLTNGWVDRSDSPLYTAIVGGNIAVIVITIAASAKFIAIGPWTVNGATLIWPMTFVFNDVFTEVYGYKRSRRIIWTGMAVQALTAFC